LTQPVAEGEARDPADGPSSKAKALITRIDTAMTIKSRIARMEVRIAKWDKEAVGVETSWIGGPAYIKFCEEMAGAARAKKAELEKEVKLLAPGP
jgi:hypothetical protein